MSEWVKEWLTGAGGLLRVRGLMTILVVAVTAAMWLMEIEVSEPQMGLVGLIVGSYLTKRAGQG